MVGVLVPIRRDIQGHINWLFRGEIVHSNAGGWVSVWAGVYGKRNGVILGNLDSPERKLMEDFGHGEGEPVCLIQSINRPVGVNVIL